MRRLPIEVYIVLFIAAWGVASRVRADLVTYPGAIFESYTPLIVAGDPAGSPPDSPANRVDPNTTTSPFAGVGSLNIAGSFICTGTAISPIHVLTAAHCLDTNNDGVIDFTPNQVVFNLNFGGDLTHSIAASSLAVHPQFTGFNNPNVNDDIAVITLSSPLPAGVPIYPLYLSPLTSGTTLTLVGYGQSGTGTAGYTIGASFTVKRQGKNQADAGILDDEGSGKVEVFLFDFDGPTGNGPLGGPTLGNDVETTTGPGDSGGPAFVLVGSTYFLAGVNTFTAKFTGGPDAPFFGSGGGGMIVSAYADFIFTSTGIPEPSSAFVAGSLALAAAGIVRRKRQKPSPA
ncbi:MAG: hypothetical protein KatS3mg110_3059 [Pirellulaceae bacterium]|nr:MAG: hypothetical protein KatS3mg110_3059 [Pirellulaceae bacterium]